VLLISSLTAQSHARYLLILSFGFLFCSAAFIIALETTGQITGATWLPRNLAAAQAANRSLVVLPAEIHHWAALKLQRIADDQPDIVLLGSSRGNEVRAVMFRPYTFYNASVTAWSFGQTIDMLDHVTKISQPRVTVLALDYFMFTNAFARDVEPERTMYFDDDLRIKYQSEIDLVRALYKDPYLLQTIVDNQMQIDPVLGIGAWRHGGGFRHDGSFQYPNQILDRAPERVKEGKGLIEGVPGGPHIDEEQLLGLKRLAALARNRGTKLIAIQFPIVKVLTDYLDHDPSYKEAAGVWREFESEEMIRTLQELDIPFFDMSRLPLAANAQNFVDGIHVTETGARRMFFHLCHDDRFRTLFPALDWRRLRTDLSDGVDCGLLHGSA
jgi:hypothetical protein